MPNSIFPWFEYKNQHLLIVILIICLMTKMSFGQSIINSPRLGVNVGFGTQNLFPFNNPYYDYSPFFIKGSYSIPYIKKRKIGADLLIEFGYYRAQHQLLNEFFVRPESGPDYREKAAIFILKKTIQEYVINVGSRIYFHASNKLSFYLFGSIGPMYMDTETERMAKGFAFSDIAGVGLLINFNNVVFEIRPTIRHVSNADIQRPNLGHNSSNIEIGLSFLLGKEKKESIE